MPSRFYDPTSDPIAYPGDEAMPEQQNRIDPTAAPSPSADAASNQVVDGGSHPWLDLNHNGIADYKEPWLWRFVWSAFSFAVRVFAPPHTIIARGVNAVEQARNTLPPM